MEPYGRHVGPQPSVATESLTPEPVNKLLDSHINAKQVMEEFRKWSTMLCVDPGLFANYILNKSREEFRIICSSHPQCVPSEIISRIYNWLELTEDERVKIWKLRLYESEKAMTDEGDPNSENDQSRLQTSQSSFALNSNRNGFMIIRNKKPGVKIAAEIPSSSLTETSELSSDPPTASNNLVVDSPTPVSILSASQNAIPQDSRFKLLKMFYHDLPEMPEFKTLVDATPSKFGWLVTFPIDPKSDFIPETLFKYDFLPNVSFKLDNSISEPHVSFCGSKPIPFVGYNLYLLNHHSLQTDTV